MAIDTKTIMDKVLAELRSDPTLSEHVKSISHGNLNFARKQFPFIEAGRFSYEEGELLEASGTLVYTVDIYAGARSLAPGAAYEGSGSGAKGVVELCEDIMRLCVNNTFGGAFIKPVVNVSNNPRYLFDKAETICVGLVSFTGEVWFRYMTK